MKRFSHYSYIALAFFLIAQISTGAIPRLQKARKPLDEQHHHPTTSGRSELQYTSTGPFETPQETRERIQNARYKLPTQPLSYESSEGTIEDRELRELYSTTDESSSLKDESPTLKVEPLLDRQVKNLQGKMQDLREPFEFIKVRFHFFRTRRPEISKLFGSDPFSQFLYEDHIGDIEHLTFKYINILKEASKLSRESYDYLKREASRLDFHKVRNEVINQAVEAFPQSD